MSHLSWVPLKLNYIGLPSIECCLRDITVRQITQDFPVDREKLARETRDIAFIERHRPLLILGALGMCLAQLHLEVLTGEYIVLLFGDKARHG